MTFVGITSMTTTKPKAPVAKQVSHELKLGKNVHPDPYFWLRSDDRDNPDVLAHLEQVTLFWRSSMNCSRAGKCVLRFDAETHREGARYCIQGVDFTYERGR